MFVLSLLAFLQDFNSTEYLNLNFYQLIGVSPSSPDSEIANAYNLFLERKKNTINPNAQTKKLLKQTDFAFSILSNPSARALYDLTGTNFLNVTGFSVMGYQNDNTIEALKSLMGKIPKEIAEYGGMISYPIEFSVSDFMNGCKKNVTVSRLVSCKCPHSSKSCPECPFPYKEELVTHLIRIPPGAPQFHRISVKGLGDTSDGRGASDIIFVAISEKTPGFFREGADIHTYLNLTLHQMLHKENIIIKNIDGSNISVPITVFRNMTNNEVRIPGKGFPQYLNPKEKGDLIVHVSFIFPKKFSQEQLDAFRELSSNLNDL